MLKRIVILTGFLTALVSLSHGQTFSEWFKQKKTQKKYLIEQIAAFETYNGVLARGYEIARFGLGTIGDIRQGEFNLHSDVFGRLLGTNPKIGRYVMVADIVAIQIDILKVYEKCTRDIRQSDVFNSAEREYVTGVFDRLLEDCTNVANELISLTSSSQMTMSDADRLRRIDALYAQMVDMRMFTSHFSGETGLLAIARERELHADRGTAKLYGIDGNN